ncbi:elongator complex protein 3 [Fusobacterium sp. PH5-44]|uniref:elongator complex protein 3 n=1 Tax=unclassified Fusobacterium TaxID=2648384 RepID=UPI003D1E5E15
MKHYNIPIFVNHYGCPNSCVFCNQKKINGVETDITAEDVEQIILSHLDTLPQNATKEVAFFGGTFTGLSINTQIKYLNVVQKFIKENLISGIRLSTRPDYINEDNLKILKDYNVTLIELGVQSLDEKVLIESERGYTYDTVKDSCNLIKKYGFSLGVQMMIGLPFSNYESDLFTCKELISFSPDVARIYPTLVIKDTKLQEFYNCGKYIPLSIENAINISKKIYAFFQINGINIIRVGLQPSDDLRKNGVVLAGPFHPAFRELVVGEIYFDFFKKILSLENKLKIISNEKNISSIIGIQKRNKDRFGHNFQITIDNNIGYNTICVNNKFYNKKEIYLEEVK